MLNQHTIYVEASYFSLFSKGIKQIKIHFQHQNFFPCGFSSYYFAKSQNSVITLYNVCSLHWGIFGTSRDTMSTSEGYHNASASIKHGYTGTRVYGYDQ